MSIVFQLQELLRSAQRRNLKGLQFVFNKVGKQQFVGELRESAWMTNPTASLAEDAKIDIADGAQILGVPVIIVEQEHPYCVWSEDGYTVFMSDGAIKFGRYGSITASLSRRVYPTRYYNPEGKSDE